MWESRSPPSIQAQVLLSQGFFAKKNGESTKSLRCLDLYLLSQYLLYLKFRMQLAMKINTKFKFFNSNNGFDNVTIALFAIFVLSLPFLSLLSAFRQDWFCWFNLFYPSFGRMHSELLKILHLVDFRRSSWFMLLVFCLQKIFNWTLWIEESRFLASPFIWNYFKSKLSTKNFWFILTLLFLELLFLPF